MEPSIVTTTTWTNLLKQAVGSIIESGPLAALLLVLLGAIGFVIYRVCTKVVWPWLTGTAERALSEAKQNREQRDAEREHDARDKAELHMSFRKAIDMHTDTAKAQGVKIDEHGVKIDTLTGKFEELRHGVLRHPD